MAANLTSVVMQFLTPEVVGQIASFLGIDKAAAQKAAAGTVPALLAGLSDLVASPAGHSNARRSSRLDRDIGHRIFVAGGRRRQRDPAAARKG